MTAEFYISHFSHSSSPLLVTSLGICVDDFQYIRNWRVQKAQKGCKCSNSCSLDAKQT